MGVFLRPETEAVQWFGLLAGSAISLAVSSQTHTLVIHPQSMHTTLAVAVISSR